MTGEVCIDACLITKWYVPEEHREQALQFAQECEDLDIRYVAPEFVIAEATNAILKNVRRGTVEPMEGLLAMSVLSQVRISKFNCSDLYLDAWRIALTYDRPAIYDCYYLALAEDRGCDFWTADQRFFNAVGNHPRVKHIKNYKPGLLGV